MMRTTQPTIPRNKSRALYAVLNVVVPGVGDIYLGPPAAKLGWSIFLGFLLCFPMIFAFGLGLLLMPVFWLASVWSVMTTFVYTARARDSRE